MDWTTTIIQFPVIVVGMTTPTHHSMIIGRSMGPMLDADHRTAEIRTIRETVAADAGAMIYREKSGEVCFIHDPGICRPP
jgi:hypothetical protein